jgi:hypothetical protein
MPLLAVVTQAHPRWTDRVRGLAPGAHVALLADEPSVSIEGRMSGLELRDTILVLRRGPTVSFVFLYRMPLVEATVVEQVMATGTGGIQIDACRVSTDECLRGGRHSLSSSARQAVYGRGINRPSREAYVQPSGRWPSNLVLIHGDCHLRCEPACPARLLDEQSEDSQGAARYYPQFMYEADLVSWLRRLVGHSRARVVGRRRGHVAMHGALAEAHEG